MHLNEFYKLTSGMYNQIFTSVLYSESGLKVEKPSKTTDTMNHLGRCNQSKRSFCLPIGKRIRHTVGCWFICHKKGEPRVSLKVPYVGLQRNLDSNMPHCFSYGCSNSTRKYSISELSFSLPFEPTRTETVI